MFKTQVLVIKKQNYRETDRILTVLSPDFGKKTVIAKGIRKPLSKMAGHLDTLMLAKIILTHDQELPTVISCDLTAPFEQIRKSLPKMDQASSIIRLIDKAILENVDQEHFFNLTIGILNHIDKGNPWPNNWLYFLSKILTLLGLECSSAKCSVCREKINMGYKNIADRDMFCERCVKDKNNLIQLDERELKLIYILNNYPLEKIERIPIPEETAQRVEEVLLRDITEWLGINWNKYTGLK